MITSKEQLNEYLSADAKASNRKSVKAHLFGDEIWKFQISLRKLEYYSSLSKIKKIFALPIIVFTKYRYHSLSIKLGFSIPINVFEKGLSIPHYGTIVVSHGARIGENCRIHEGVTIGATNGSSLAATIGDNVFIGSGAKIIGNVTIADRVCIGANAVVAASITEAGTTWGGVPARKISDRDSAANLSQK